MSQEMQMEQEMQIEQGVESQDNTQTEREQFIAMCDLSLGMATKNLSQVLIANNTPKDVIVNLGMVGLLEALDKKSQLSDEGRLNTVSLALNTYRLIRDNDARLLPVISPILVEMLYNVLAVPYSARGAMNDAFIKLFNIASLAPATATTALSIGTAITKEVALELFDVFDSVGDVDTALTIMRHKLVLPNIEAGDAYMETLKVFVEPLSSIIALKQYVDDYKAKHAKDAVEVAPAEETEVAPKKKATRRRKAPAANK